jgi:hypothetical protein
VLDVNRWRLWDGRSWGAVIFESWLVDCLDGLEDCNRNPDCIAGAMVLVFLEVVVGPVMMGFGEGLMIVG